jgi:hypothetical protein
MKADEYFVQEADDRPLSQEELERWWPFERLEPKRFPNTPATNPLEEFEDAPF